MESGGEYVNQDTSELSWTDQWDNKYDDEQMARGYDGDADNSRKKKNKKKVAEYNDKVRRATITGFVKSAAVIGAEKLKTGTSTGISWIKQQYHKKPTH
ncbi:hypothetical protein O6H91_05G009500 [Diphasiastrum complanatum]|uniref:Uncharacterized protein n=1 Tax=Diphasiastrum complanatum TaxID=34168 RepID=A0ACC2DKW9_DIPCM|nr:hypothetical protein O6H91_05G009500 [Diphasiastrum complanatum]